MNKYTYVTPLSCAFGALVFHESSALLGHVERHAVGIATPREVPLTDDNHGETHQGPPPRYVRTMTATGTSVSSLQQVIFVGSQAFTFHV